MDTQITENLNAVQSTNQDLLDYFNNRYVEKLEQIQALKTEQFELKAKINELEKTLDVYSFKTSAGQNVFSPFSSTATSQQEKASQIELNLEDLNEVKKSLDTRIDALQDEITHLKQRINSINDSNKKLDNTIVDLNKKAEADAANVSLSRDECNKLAKKINDTTKEMLQGNIHKLELLSWLLKTDVTRARVTLDELVDSTNKICDSLDDIVSDLTLETDERKQNHEK